MQNLVAVEMEYNSMISHMFFNYCRYYLLYENEVFYGFETTPCLTRLPIRGLFSLPVNNSQYQKT